MHGPLIDITVFPLLVTLRRPVLLGMRISLSSHFLGWVSDIAVFPLRRPVLLGMRTMSSA